MTTDSIISWIDARASSYDWTNYEEDDVKKTLLQIYNKEPSRQFRGFIYGGKKTKYYNPTRDGLQKWIESDELDKRVKDTNKSYLDEKMDKINKAESTAELEAVEMEVREEDPMAVYLNKTKETIKENIAKKKDEIQAIELREFAEEEERIKEEEVLDEVEKATVEDIDEVEKTLRDAETQSIRVKAGIKLRNLIREREDVQSAFSTLSDNELINMAERANVDTIKRKYYLNKAEVVDEYNRRGLSEVISY